jgi:hypothetical protein
MRQRRCADSISLKAIASPAAFDPWPLVTFVRPQWLTRSYPGGEVLHRVDDPLEADGVKPVEAVLAPGSSA